MENYAKDAVATVKDLMWSNLSERAFTRVERAAKRRHLTVEEFLKRTASNVLRYGSTRRYTSYLCD